MSEPKLISPLLDGFSVGDAISNHNGVRCYPALKENSDKKYILKIISIPASQVQLDALLLTGAYTEPSSAMDYFHSLAEQVEKEAAALKNLSRVEGFLSFEGWQVVPMEDRLGYEVYLVSGYRLTLESYLRRNTMTHLGAVNLGIDICAALSAARRAGWIYADLRPSNIFISENKEYRIGDLGLMELEGLELADLPGKYHSAYTAPELDDPMVSPNTTMDTYALGMILYQIFNNGCLPQVAHPTEDVPAPPANADYEMAEIILKACDPNPGSRWESPVQMGQALVAYMQRNTVNDVPVIPPLAEITDTAGCIAADAGEDISPDAEEAVLADDTQLSPEISALIEQADACICQEPPAVVAEAVPDPQPEADAPWDETVPAEIPGPEMAWETDNEPEEEIPIPEKKKAKRSRKHRKDQVNLDRQRKKSRFVRILLTLTAILLAASLAVGGYLFYANYYIQMIHGLSVTGRENQMTVWLETDIPDDLLTVICTDSYGNTKIQPVQNGVAEFTQLLPDMLYKIRVEIEGFHQLKGSTTHEYVTPNETKIVSYTAATGPEDGTVILSFSVDGPDSEQWTVTCTAEGEEPVSTVFTGHVVTVNGLTVGKTYTMRLDPVSELYIPGTNALEFTAASIVIAEDLKIALSGESSINVTWNAPEGSEVSQWTVRCYSMDGYDQTVTTTELSTAFDGITFGTAYAVEVTAAGMTQPARASMTANPLTVTGIQVDDSNQEQLTVSWDFEGDAPAGGWLLLYTIDGNGQTQVVQCSENTGIIEVRVPAATYDLTIQAADGSTVFNNTHSFDTPNAKIYRNDKQKVFEHYHTRFLFADLLKTPEKKNWNHLDVHKSQFTTSFRTGDPISLHLYYMADFYLYHEDISIMYVIRDSEGRVLSDLVSMENRDWHNDMWNGPNYHYCCLNIPKVPTEPGTYSLGLYFDGMAITSVEFTISE